MQHALRISRKIEYGLRAMVCLASLSEGEVLSFREIARRMDVPETFLAKILKTLVSRKLVRSSRGAQGGYQLARPAKEISFLEVIEAVEGPIGINHCATEQQDACKLSSSCTMWGVWRLGQERMLEVYRSVSLDQLAMRGLKQDPPLRPLAASN